MHARSAVLAVVVATAVTACGTTNDEPDSTSKTSDTPSVAASTPAGRKELAPVYTPKLDAVSEGSIENCQTPSSPACANDVGAIMTVVDDLEKDIEAQGGASAYPKSTKQIAQMRAAQREYKDNGCEGEPGADDPNSDCWGVVSITLGATTLGMTLTTDDLT